MSKNHIEKILLVAQIRKAVNSHFVDGDSNYFDVMEKIIIPSEDGQFSEYDAIFLVNKEQEKWVKEIFGEELCRNISFINL